MALATWWTSDPLMELTPVADFQVRLAADDAQRNPCSEPFGSHSLTTMRCAHTHTPPVRNQSATASTRAQEMPLRASA